jgi:hypothetical protein
MDMNEIDRRLSAVEAKVGIEKDTYAPKHVSAACVSGGPGRTGWGYYCTGDDGRVAVYAQTEEMALRGHAAMCRGWNDPLGRLIEWMETSLVDDSDGEERYAKGKKVAYTRAIEQARAIRDGRE